MAATMTCPLCHNEHPTATTWCPVLFQDISHLLNGADPVTATEEPGPAPDPAAIGLVHCPTCGAPGRPSDSCIQCIEIIPEVGSSEAPVQVVLPTLDRVTIPRGTEIIIGRHSEVAEIRGALEMFDGVSRQHCYILVNRVRDTLTIRDPQSLNRTWVGEDERELEADEVREVALPVRLRLGHTAYVTITPEGA